MTSLPFLQAGLIALWALFTFAFGACAGSLINVLVYRLPRGLDVVVTGSACPACGTKLTWRENIPVFGWLFLRGRCRFCRSRISAEYPLVETLVGGLWMLMYLLYYATPPHFKLFGVEWAAIAPQWATNDAFPDHWPRTSWPPFAIHLLTVALLVAMTLVDAKTYTIPLVLPWAATLIGVVLHPVGALLVGRWVSPQVKHIHEAVWGIPTPGWPNHAADGRWWIGASIGGMLGLLVSNLLLHFRLIRRSFEDYAEWEKGALKAAGLDPDKQPMHADVPDEGVPVGEHVGPGVRLVMRFVLVWAVCAMGLGAAGPAIGRALGWPSWAAFAIGAVGGPLVAALACRPLSARNADKGRATATASGLTEVSANPSAPELWIAYPHARREMLKELVFLTPCIGLGWLGAIIAVRMFPLGLNPTTPPLWLAALCGSLMGYLIGGGVVWGIRIFGSLGFGKEAMGLGDVHLMAGVGACLGWVTAGLAVPLAAVVGLYFVIIAMLANRPAGKTMPFGPYLAVATLLVLFGRPLVETGLTRLLGMAPGSIKLP
jgi:prepilin signal peptidase PulO-like enzyme (type II secretory pathway)